MAGYGKEIHGLMKALDAIRGDSIDMPVQQALTVFAVALQPGLTMQELAATVNMSQSSCSRNIAALGKWHRLGKPGANLVEAHEDPRERRRKVMYLTTLGRTRVTHALEAITGGPVQFDPRMARDGLSYLK